MKKGNATKENIYNAAKTLFYEKGYNATTIQQIAKLAQVTLGGTTYHYNTKEKFVSQIFSSWNDAIYGEIRRSDISNEKSIFQHFVLTYNYHHAILDDDRVKAFYYEIIRNDSLYPYLYENLYNVYYNFVREFDIPISQKEIESVIICDFGARREFMTHVIENKSPITDPSEVSMFVFSNTLRALGIPRQPIEEIGKKAFDYYEQNPYSHIKLLI